MTPKDIMANAVNIIVVIVAATPVNVLTMLPPNFLKLPAPFLPIYLNP